MAKICGHFAPWMMQALFGHGKAHHFTTQQGHRLVCTQQDRHEFGYPMIEIHEHPEHLQHCGHCQTGLGRSLPLPNHAGELYWPES